MSFSSRIKVLCVLDYYSPGFKGGGPIRTLENMVARLSDEIEFSIFTRDRDLGSTTAFPDVKIDEWQNVHGARVYYASPAQFSLRGLLCLGRRKDFDVLYLNSFFSLRASILPLVISRFAGFSSAKVILAPRGEFSLGALSIKRAKKRAFILIAKILCIYNKIYWQASTKTEAEDIFRTFPDAAKQTFIASDLVAPTPRVGLVRNRKKTSHLRVVFISRISPMKNLLGLLSALKSVTAIVELSVYGPIEDNEYWRQCHKVIQSLPKNITVKYLGCIAPKDVLQRFAEHDVFIFPTLGENFGHVIFESLSAGTPVVLSDQTPWPHCDDGAIEILPLSDLDLWSTVIDRFAKMDDLEYERRCAAAHRFALHYLNVDQSKVENIAMFQSIINV